MPKDYTEPYTTPYYDELKKHGIHLPCFLTHIRTDECRRVKPKDAKMFRMMFTPPEWMAAAERLILDRAAI